jgi:23S rRNA (uracil1939-C5)-methyltransferase
MAEAADLVIARLGAQGDGVAERAGHALYVPFALPGERWRESEGMFTRLSDAPGRQEAICQHFTRCGGCVAQHMSDDLYASWKQGIVADAFHHRGIEAEIAPLVRVKANSRRRAYFGVERKGSSVIIGFREEGQHRLVDLAECPVLDPLIVRALGALKEMARIAMREREGGRLLVTRLDHGLDVAFENGRKDLVAADRGELAKLAGSARFIRLTVGGEAIMESGRPVLTIGDVEIEPAQGVFLQAVPEAEALLIDLVTRALPKRAKSVADLFCGIGTLTFPLARVASVTAFDSDKRAMAAMGGAIRRTQGLKPIDARQRDLFRDPLSVRELNGFDAVVFDPPRAGAAEQAERLAQSKVPVIIAVSCNPATLARDARALIDGGYNMGVVTPIDQFIYSPHVEAVAVFKR